MDMRSAATIKRKIKEMRIVKEKVFEKRKEAEVKNIEARRKQRNKEISNAKSTKALNHSNRLRRDREKTLINIGKYQKQIDICTTKITSCEKQIDLLRKRIHAPLADMRTKVQEARHLRWEADSLKREADVNCILGKTERELHGQNKYSRHRKLLRRAVENMQKAINVNESAQGCDKSANKDKHKILILGHQMLINSKWKGELDENKRQEEQRVAQLGEKLRTYKIEISNCEYLSKQLREEEAQNEAACIQLKQEALKAERLAEQAEAEVKELESELESKFKRKN